MDLSEARECALSKRGAIEAFPFGPEIPVYKVMDKIFMLAMTTYPYSINLKCDPSRAVELCERYDAVQPGYHMNKTHWNTIDLTMPLPFSLTAELINHSYELIAASLPKKKRELLELL